MKTPKPAKKVKAAVVKEAGDKSKKKVRTRLTGVRGRVLSLLASGPLTSSELVSKGGFSAASLYLNLKALKKDGMIATTRNGRSVAISLVEGAVQADAPVAGAAVTKRKYTKKGTPKAAPTSALVAAYVPRDLHGALEALARRLSPVDGVKDKLLVLDQLARTMPAPVSAVLQEIMADLARLA